jgi:uncharacterized protein
VPAPTARERLAELYVKVDSFFQRAAARFSGPGDITCHAGCDDCCRRRFTVTAIEAEVIAEGLASLPAEVRELLAARSTRGDPAVCPALEADGRCAIYPYRPVICRTHGLPIRFAPPPPARSLPIVDACPRNFAGRDLGALPAEVVLDQTTVSTILGALDAARAAEAGQSGRPRVSIAALLGH